MTASVDRAGPCEDCGAPRERGQRYCLECGARAGSRSPQLDELLARARAQRAAGRSELAGLAVVNPSGAPAPPVPSSGPPSGGLGSRLSALALPSSRVSAALVLMFLAFGVLVGGVVGTPVQDTLAADAGRHVKLILPPAAPAAVTTATTPEAASPPSSEPPAATSESTPAATAPATTPSTGTKPASGRSSSPSGSSGKGAGSGGGSEGGSTTPAPGGSSSKLPPVKHVFVIMLSDQPYASVFGPTAAAPYLSRTLEHKGELLVRYYAVAHQQLANGIALISGQGPTAETAANCPTYSDIVPATVGADEQVTGQGCVYPSSTETLPGQLTAKHLTWRAYIEGMDEGASGMGAPPAPADGACGHPALGAAAGGGAPIPVPTPPAGQTYATWRNPFVYLQSLIGSPACASNDVGLDKLASDLSNPKSTPSFAYIAPDLCHDGSPTPCASGAPAGIAAAEGFLKRVVPEILGSKAYKESGLLAITVDEAPSSGEFADSSSCCGQPQFPNLPPSTSALGPEGGGQVGALLLSPYIAKAGVSQEPYNHFSLLRTTEDLFGLKHLGYAGLSKVNSFEPSIFAAHP